MSEAETIRGLEAKFGGRWQRTGIDAHGRPMFARVKPGNPENTVRVEPAKARARIRQDKGPNQLELEAERVLLAGAFGDVSHLRAQALRFKLANGVTYTPDLTGWVGTHLHAWEVKGPQKIWDDAVVKIKVAAAVWKDVSWWMIWKEDGRWLRQRIGS